MPIKWKIVRNNKSQGCVEVLWWDEESGLSFGPYNCDITNGDGTIPYGDDLLRKIHAFTPLGEIDKQIKAKALGANAMDFIDALIGVEHIADLGVFVVKAGCINCGD